MLKPIAAFCLVWVLVPIAVWAEPAPSPVSSPAGGVTPYPLPAGCLVDTSMSFAEALGRPIRDPVALRFVERVGAMSGADLKAAAGATSVRVLDYPLTKSSYVACVGPLVSVIAMRALIFAGQSHPDDLSSLDQGRFLYNLVIAAEALTTRATLTNAIVSEAIAPFGSSEAELDATAPSPEPSPTCSIPDGRVHVVEKLAPTFVRGSTVHPGGDELRVTVHLDTDGLVEAVWLSSSTLPPDSPLIPGTLLAAMRSTYGPAIVHCVPAGGDYLFVASFSPI